MSSEGQQLKRPYEEAQAHALKNTLAFSQREKASSVSGFALLSCGEKPYPLSPSPSKEGETQRVDEAADRSFPSNGFLHAQPEPLKISRFYLGIKDVSMKRRIG